MNLFDDIATDDLPLFAEIDPALRQRLIGYLALQMVITEHKQMLMRLMIDQLSDPTAEGEERIKEYKEQKIAPLNEQLKESFGELCSAAVDVDGIKSMLPMIATSITQKANLSVLATLVNIDPVRAQKLTRTIREFCESNLG